MKTSVCLTSFLLTLALAMPAPSPNDQDDKPKKGKCVKPPEAKKFIERYTGFLSREGSDLGDARATGDALIADDIEQYSFSVNSVRGKPVSDNGPDAGLLQKGKDGFLDNVLSTPMLPPKGIKTLSALAACEDGNSKIIWQWQFDSVGDGGAKATPIRGFTLFDVVRDKGPREFKVERINIEFDSIAWAADLGKGNQHHAVGY
ncbi:hypothetical protein Slin15195_G113590 [Septoria linicola]|uniref:NTF2-like domain-containing protein n=1 Tax=Septoria linicola TaxID=215465 RepID=A0A9Q9AZN9_9PEZI|nr:hypothetical protein Slin15195_G113590 [Septoria linicola]